MSALGSVVRSGVGRRRVQTVVIGLVVLIAVTAAVLGGSLMVASHAPFDRAFGQQHGAHLTARFDPAEATEAQLTASAHATGVVAAAGPFRTASISPVDLHGQVRPSLTVVGRADPGGPVDDVTLTEGRWVTGPGEIVLFGDGRQAGPMSLLGRVLRLPDLPGSPTLTVVGVARSISETAGGWVSPQQMAALTAPGSAGSYQMLYRFASAGSSAQVDADRAAVTASVPAGALTAATSWLTTRRDSTGRSVLFVPFLIAFGVLGVLMAVLIVGNVVAGAVSTATRRIGVLKALGFTPSQVVRAYLGQALIPAVVGAALGVVAGDLLTVSVLRQTNEIYGTSDSGVAPWVDVVVVAGALLLVTMTAWAAASRAGRLRTVDALAVGRTPHPGRGRWAARLTGRLPAPRPVTLGLAHPFARPVRSATIVTAIMFGAAAVTFGTGLASSLHQIDAISDPADVTVQPGIPAAAGSGKVEHPKDPAGSTGPPKLDPAAVAGAIAAQAGTAGYCGLATTDVTVGGISGPVEVLAFTGDAGAQFYRMIKGTWFAGPGEIVVATPFLTATGTKVGDSVVLSDHGTALTVRIVGEAFNTENDGRQILTAAATLATAEPDLQPSSYDVTVRPGTDLEVYAAALAVALEPLGAHAEANQRGTSSLVIVIDGLAGLLTVLLVVVAGLGVLNMVVLETRERVHDLGVHKALGMTPRQTTAMVIASVVVTGVLGGVLGAPVGVFLQRTIVGAMGHAAGFNLPASVLDVYSPVELVLFAVGGLLIAVLGALLPAGWAARVRTATALRTE